MTNANEELIEFLEDKPPVLCISFARLTEDYVAVPQHIGDLDTILPLLNFDYDSGFGIQELYGTIWFYDGTWAERREYDGSEWWEYFVCPPIPPGFSLV
jgi:hypothetical protein